MSKSSKDILQQSKLILEELEERRLFSGGIEGLIDPSLDSDANAIYSDINGSQAQADSTSADTAVAEQISQEIVFVDAGVDNHQQLVDDLLANSDSSRNIEVVVLDQEKDGIEQISDFLSNRDDLDAVHIISHGDDGSIQLGNASLNAETLEDNNLKIALWANSFAETGDILIYGCNLAGSEVGQSLIEDLGALTLTDVAASDDVTGHASLGGDWELEHAAGSIEAEVAVSESAQQQWNHALDISTGLQLHQTYDAGQGAQDSSGNSRDGTLEDNAAVDTTPATNQVGDGKLILDGTDDYVNLSAHTAALDGFTEGTIGAWINTSAASQQMIFNLGDSSGSDFATLQLTGGGNLQWWVSESGADTVNVTSTASFNDGNWHHVAVTVGPSGNSLWVDGVELTGGAVSYTSGSAASTNFFDDLTSVARAEVGAYELSGTVYDEFSGLIDDFRIYDRALTAGDIAELQVITASAEDLFTGYPAGDLDGNAGGSGFTDAWTSFSGSDNIQVVATGLTHPTSGPDTTDAIQLNQSGLFDSFYERTLASPYGTVDETIWASFLIEPQEQAGSGSYMGVVLGSGGYFNTNQLFFGYEDSTFKMNNWSGGGTAHVDATAAVSGETAFVVLRLDISSSGNDTATLFVNPNSGEPTPSVSGTTQKVDLDLTNLDTITIVGGAVTSNPTLMGGLRIGSSFADVAPAGSNSDPTFLAVAGDGIVETDFAAGTDEARSVVVQPDGKILVAGTSGTDFALTRYNADGTLDTGFDGDGMVTTSVGGQDYAMSVTLQPDGKILAAGSSNMSGDNDFSLVRYNIDGSLDTGFDGDGMTTVNFGASDTEWGQDVTVQPDGKILVTGYSQTTGLITLARVNADGTLDTSFDSDGKVTTDIGSGIDRSYSISVQSDGKILVAGGSFDGGVEKFSVARYNADGSLDTGFDGDGKVITTISGSIGGRIYSITEQPDGKILVVGGSHDGSNIDFALVRYNADGSLDTGFDGDGIVTTPIGGGDDWAYSATLQADGKILAAGYTQGATQDFALVRYNADGSLDTSFDGDGKLVTDIAGGNDIIYDVSVQADGRIVVAGSSDNDFGVVRYLADGTLDAEFDAVNTLDGNPTFTEGGAAVVLDADVDISDTELDALNGGLGNYSGASLTLVRDGGANSDDVFTFNDGNGITLSGADLLKNGKVIATFDVTTTPGELVITFTDANIEIPTSADVDNILRQITYANSSTVPQPLVQIGWTFGDGSGGLTTGSTYVNITNVAPVISATGAAAIHVGQVYTLNLSTSDPIDTWTINWGDGMIDTIPGNQTSTTHVYNVAGLTNNITISATDATGTYYDSSLIIGNAASGADGFLLMAGFDPDTGLADIAGAQILNTPTPSDLDWAADVIVGPDGDIYATGYQSNNVVRFDGSTGAFVEEFVTMTRPVSIAFGPNGNLFVASDLGHVKEFDGTDGSYVGDFLTLGYTPEEMTFGDDGNLYVGQYDPGRIYRYDGITGAPIDGGAAFIDPELTGPTNDDINHSEQFAFGPDGNIYVASIDDGKIQRYDGTTGAFIDTFATPGNVGAGWPDGPTGVAFGPDGNLYVTKVDRVERYDGTTGAYIDDYIAAGSGLDNPWFSTFTPNHQVAVLPVGAPIAVADSVNTLEDIAVVIDVLANDSDPDFDPLTAQMITGPSNGTLVPNPVELINQTNLTNDAANDREAQMSPDGTQIVFRSDRSGNNDIWVMDIDGSNPVQLTSDAGSDIRPVWSPDGSQILFTSDRSGDKDIWIMNANGSGQVNLTNNVLGDDRAASWSPDGSQITFVTTRDGNDEIYVMNANGSGQTNISNNAAKDSGADWSPDGSKILFVSDRGGNSDIYVMDTNGSNVTNLSNNAAVDSNASWSPDGSKIVFKTDRDGNEEIYVMDADGTDQTRLTDNAFVDGAPSWSPDGSQIIFQTSRDGNHEIYIADISSDGTFTYTPVAGFTGVDSFTYVANDGSNDSNVATVTINVTSDTPAVITGDTSYSGDEGDAVAGDLNATDVDGLTDGTYFSVTTPASNGTATIDPATGAWTFTPTDSNWFGSDSFTVTVTDDLGGTTTQVVSVTLANVNDPVTAVDDAYNVSEDGTFDSSSEWFDSNWSYSRTLSFDNATRTENLVDFPILVKLDSSVIDYAKTHDQGWDLRFFDQDGSALAHEIEHWDEAGTSYVWVKIPQIDASSSADSIVMYYGNAGVGSSGEDSAGVWSDYRATYHLNENPGATGTLADSAGNFDATNASSTDTAGIIGNAQDFNGVDQSINLGDDRNWINNASGATLSIWMNADTTSGSGDLIGLSRNDPADTGASRITLIRNGDDIQMIARSMDDSSDTVSVSTSTNPLSAGTWHHITGTVDYSSDTDNIKIYVDGQLEGTFSHNFTLDAIPNTDSSHAAIGSDEDGTDSPFDGQLDEARIADQVRSADWISAQYAAMTGNLVGIGAEQTVHGVLINDVDEDGDALTVTQMNGAPAAVGVATALPSGALVTLNADGSFVYDTNGAFESLAAGASTTDAFTYQVIDGNGSVETATVTMTIDGEDDAPLIGGTDSGAVTEDVGVVGGNISASGSLTISDDDAGESSFQAETITGTYGDLTIDGAGNWTYSADNSQAAIQQLDVTEFVTDTLTVTTADGSTHDVVITINGAEDTPQIGGVDVGTVAEDGTLTASDTLTITDVDTSDNPVSFNDVAATLGGNGYGDFEMTAGTWTYTLNNGHAAVQALDAGETLSDTYTFTATDGSSQLVTVTINGAEDAPVFDSTAVTAATEDVAYSYTITTSDVDVESVTITAPTLPAWLTFVDNGDGTATLSGTPTNAEVGNHNVVLNVSDGTLSSNQNFTITVSNTNDPAVIGGVDTGSVQEDVGVVANNISTGGLLTIADPDVGESTFQAETVTGTYGDLTIDAAGNWTYTADNTQAAIQQLDVGEFLTDTLMVTSFDGTTHNVVITINGSEDASVISGTTTGSVTEDGTLTSSGLLVITDTDSSDPTSFVDVTPQAGDNGYGTFEITANTWTYVLDNNDPAVQALDVGETLTDTYTFTAPDGETQLVTVTINGAEDAPVFDSTAVTAATEDIAYSYTITTSDVDIESVVITAPTLPAWLTFVDNGDGTATLSGTPTNAEVGNHNVVLNVSDGTLSSNQNFTITVSNTNDPAVIGGVDTGAVQEDVGVVTNNISTGGLLTIADPDTGESTFQAETVTGTYGDLTIDAAGNWTYTADNTQAAIQQLDVGEFLTDTLMVTSFDGTTHNVVITINGSEDASVISGTTTGSVTEDGTLTSSGLLVITDTDSSDPTDFVDVLPQAGDNGHGTFEITANTWTYVLDNNDPAVQALDVGETLTDTYTFTAPDGETQLVTVTINGAEDAPVFDSTAVTAATEDVAYSYTITTSDVDVESVTITAPTLPAWLVFVDNGDGTATLSGTPTNAEVGNHNVVLNVSDGTLSSNQNFTITVSNTNDPAVIGGVDTGAVQEDVAVVANNISTGGLLTIADPDTGESTFQAETVTGTYGDLTIDAAGNWTYTADNTQAAIQQLDVGEFLTDTLMVTSFDGTTHNVVITINGSEDASVISGTTTGSVTEDGTLTSSGLLVITDTDSSDPTDFVDVTPQAGDNGHGTFEITANTWTYVLDNNDPAVQALDVGETLTDTYTFTAPDGETQLVTVTINGAEDAPVFDSTAVTAATEDVAYSYTITTSDVDVESVTITAPTLPAWLVFVDNGDGTATLSGTPTNAEVGNHNVVLNVSDGTLSSNQNFTITVSNTNDPAVIGGVDTGAVTEDAGVVAGNISTGGSMTIADPDAGESSFQAATINGTYGDLIIDSAGNWSYSADNSQISIQALDAGESLVETLTVMSFDGTTHDVVVTINGAEDAAVIGGGALGAVTEDGALTAGDALTITDADTSDNPVSFNDVAPTPGTGGYGNFEITGNTWTYTLDNGHASVQALDVGETLNDSYTFLASDGSSQLVTVTINGAEDTPTLDNAIADQSATEDIAFNFSFAVNTFGDLDSSDTLTYTATLSDNSPLPAWLSFDGLTRTFSGTPTNADVGSIDIKVTADDGSSNVTDTFTLVVNNVNDPPVIGGVDTGAVTEDVGVVGGNISTTGSLTIADPDAGESSFQTATITGSFGDLTIDTAGNWIYTADNTQAAIQALDVGESLVDTLTVAAFDGTTHNIVITINGAEDAAVIGGVAVGAVAEDGVLSVSDTLTITDADSSDNPVSFNDLPPTLGDNGYGNFEITGNTWTYTLNNAHVSVQGLDVGETLTDTYTFSASDGSPSLVIVTIDGAEDLPILGGVTIGAVSEDGTLVTSNTLTITDADSNDNPVSFDDVTPTLGANGYGTFEITGNTWTFTLDNAHAAVQGLDAGESLSDSFTFTASDGSTQLVSVTINGAEDAPTLDNAITDQTATEGTAFSFTFADNTFGDLDTSDTLTYTATLSDSSPLPAWLSFDGATRTFSGTPGAGDVGAIDIRITADDASSTIADTFTLTVDPFNNLPVIGGADRGALTEDLDVVDGQIAVSGALTIADADAGESSFVAGTVSGALGSLTIDASGNWSYSADNSNPEIQALQAGQTVIEALTVTTADGSTHEVIVTINGAQEAAPPPVVEPPVVEPPPEEEIPPPEEETKNEDSGGEDEILPEIIRVPQDSPTPAPESYEPDRVAADEPEDEAVNFGPVADKQVARVAQQPQVLQAQNLDVDSLTLQVSDDEALNEQYELELLDRIDSMHLGMDSDGARQSADDVNVQIVVGSTASLTVGIVSWVLRGGALLASFMSTVPLLNRFDPLPILKTREDEKEVESEEDDDGNTQFKEHARKVDSMFSGDDGEQS